MRCECKLVLIVFCVLLDIAEGFQAPFSKTLLQPSVKSREIPTDVMGTLYQMNKEQRPHIQLVFDKEYEEKVNIVAGVYGQMSVGMMIYKYQSGASLLRVLLESATSTATTTMLQLSCSASNILNIFQTIQAHRLHSHVVHWILMLDSEMEERNVTLGMKVLLYEGTKVTILTKRSLGNFRISTASVDSDGIFRIIKKEFPMENQEKRIDLYNLKTSFEDSYSNMHGREMVVAANNIWPFFRLRTVNADGTEIPETGIDVMILRTLSAALNFTYRVVVPEDRAWGQPKPDGTVTGLIGLVARREAHLSISIIAITSSRKTVVDYTVDYFKEPLTIFSRAPKQKNRALASLAPFNSEVWAAICTCTLAMGPALYTLLKALSSFLSAEDLKVDLRGLQDYSFNVFRSIVTQGYKLPEGHWSYRLILIFWYLFCLIVSALYSGMLMAVLAIPAYETPIDSLEDLPRAVDDGFILGVVEQSSNEYLFRSAKDGIYKETWNLFNHDDMSKSYVRSPRIGVNRVLSSKFVYIGPSTLTETIATSLGRRKFHFGRSTFYPQMVGIACPYGVPYKDKFSHLLLRIIEGGLVSKWKNDELGTISQKDLGPEEDLGNLAITTTHLQAAFFIVVCGYTVASIVLILEQVIDQYK